MANVKELFNNFSPNAETDMQPFIELIEEIMALPEEGLTEEAMKALKDLITASFTEEQQAQTINAVLQNFEASNMPPSELAKAIQTAKDSLQSVIDELKPSARKRELIESVFGIFYKIFDNVVARYHSIIIPMKLDENAKIPTYAHSTDACADLYASQNMTIPAHSLSNLVHTGLHIALPQDWVMLIDPRSSIGMKSGLRLSNSLGVIDEDYRGEIGVLYDNLSDSDYEIKAGDRIAQCWVQPVYRFKGVSVGADELPATERGEGGFGSTGK